MATRRAFFTRAGSLAAGIAAASLPGASLLRTGTISPPLVLGSMGGIAGASATDAGVWASGIPYVPGVIAPAGNAQWRAADADEDGMRDGWFE